MGIVGDHENLVAKNRGAAICTQRRVSYEPGRARTRILPDGAAGDRVQRERRMRAGDVHDTFGNNRSHFQPEVFHVLVKVRRVGEKLRPQGDREYPFRRQLTHIGRVDLSQFAVPIPTEFSIVSEPVARAGIYDTREVDSICLMSRRRGGYSRLDAG